MALLVALALQAAAAEPAPDDIVVRARKAKCEVSAADRALSDREFRARARGWAAGRPVRVTAPADADVKCLARIAFRLADRGVTRVIFVEPPGTP